MEITSVNDTNRIQDFIPAVFLHIQKTAGTTIVRLAIDHYGYENVISHGDYVGEQPSDFKRYPFVSGHFGFDFARELMPGRFSFTFLRDPLERIVSFYFFCRTRNPLELPIYRVAFEHDFDSFLRAAFTNSLVKRRIWNSQMWRLASGPGPENRCIDDIPPNEMFDMAIANLRHISYIGFFETLYEDVGRIVSALKMPPINRLEKMNATRNRPFAEDLPSRTIDLINEITVWDRKLYRHVWQNRKPAFDI